MAEPASERSDVEVVHLDMDAFFASVEVLSDPTLAGKPVVVGGVGPRGVVASASYEARAFGIRAAMPTVEARHRCPDAVFIQGHHDVYAEVSEQLFSLLRDVTPIVEPIALDEAFLDVHGAHRIFGSSFEIATGLRARVADELSLSCSVGIGRNKLIAKLASEAAKPRTRDADGHFAGRGVVRIDPSEEIEFLFAHPVRALPGVGPRTEERLRRLGVSTVRDLAVLEEPTLVSHFGNAHGRALFSLAAGNDARRVIADRPARSIGQERTFSVDDHNRASLESRLRELSGGVAERCRAAGTLGRTVQLKVRFGDFSSLTRQRQADHLLESGAEIAEMAIALLDEVEVEGGVRLIGVSVTGLGEQVATEAEQLDLFASADPGPERAREELEIAQDAIRARFGRGAIETAARFGRRDEERPGPILEH
jgi:DNA polymerase IV